MKYNLKCEPLPQKKLKPTDFSLGDFFFFEPIDEWPEAIRHYEVIRVGILGPGNKFITIWEKE